ncbi:MAG: MarR family winged helix-turn-helix transcriptional regulator [Rhodoferax sp.]
MPAPAVPELSESGARVLRQFRLIFNAVKTHFQQVEKRTGVGGAQIWALSIVEARPGIGMKDLALAMDVHQSTASNLVRSLAERELLAAVRQGTDRRTVQLKVLPAGRRMLKRSPGPFAGVLPEALATLDPATLDRLEADLAQLIPRIKTKTSDANIPLGQG